MKEVVRYTISMSSNIKYITSPMIREVVNATLLQFGFEKERLQYTRIGFPFYDLTCLFVGKPIYYSKKNINDKMNKHIRKEYYDVLDIIKKIRSGENNETL